MTSAICKDTNIQIYINQEAISSNVQVSFDNTVSVAGRWAMVQVLFLDIEEFRGNVHAYTPFAYDFMYRYMKNT